MRLLGVVASGNYVRDNPNAKFFPIATTTIGSGGAASVTFTESGSAWADYTHLQIRAIVRTTTGNENWPLRIRFNSDSSSVYATHMMDGDGSAANSGSYVNNSEIYLQRPPGNDATANVFASTIIDLLDFRNTNKYKTIKYLCGYDANGTGRVFFGSGLWRSNNAITEINFTDYSSNNLAQYSHFALYGIKA